MCNNTVPVLCPPPGCNLTQSRNLWLDMHSNSTTALYNRPSCRDVGHEIKLGACIQNCIFRRCSVKVLTADHGWMLAETEPPDSCLGICSALHLQTLYKVIRCGFLCIHYLKLVNNKNMKYIMTQNMIKEHIYDA